MLLFRKYNLIKLAENAIILHVNKLLPKLEKHDCDAKNGVMFILYKLKRQHKTYTACIQVQVSNKQTVT